MMLSAKSESDITSLAPSSPSRSPKGNVYYVQSPSRDSNDGDKSSSMQATPIYNNSPMESPSHPSFGRHSRNSSASRFSGIFRSSSGRKGSRKQRNDKGWPECNVILEEGSYDDVDKALSRRMQALIAMLSFVVLFSVFCLIIWGASRPFKAEIAVKVCACLMFLALKKLVSQLYDFLLLLVATVHENHFVILWEFGPFYFSLISPSNQS